MITSALESAASIAFRSTPHAPRTGTTEATDAILVGATPPRPVRVLHVVEALKGGPASYMREILPGQCAALGRSNVGLLIPRQQAGELPGFEDLKIGTFEQRRCRPLHIPVLAWLTLRWVRRHRPNVVHAQGTFAGIAVRLALSVLREPPKIVYCAHGWAFDRWSSHWKKRLVTLTERALAPRCDSIVCISQHDYRSALRSGIPRERLVEIRNAISDLPEQRRVVADESPYGPSGARPAAPLAKPAEPVQWPAGRRRFLFVGRFDRQKGFDVFLESMRALGDDAFAYAVGSPVVGRQEALQVPDNVVITGWLARDRVQDYIDSAEIVVVPSRWEGFGLAALEAMRAGRAIIASRIGGLPELVRHGSTGLLVPPEDAVSLAGAMRAAMHLNLASMGQRARLRYERGYRVERLDEELLALYRCLLAAEPSSVSHVRPSGVAAESPEPWGASRRTRPARRSAAYWQGSD